MKLAFFQLVLAVLSIAATGYALLLSFIATFSPSDIAFDEWVQWSALYADTIALCYGIPLSVHRCL